MTDSREELIRDVAVKHGIALGRDDPILILQTINDRLMRESATAQQAIVDSFKSELEEIAHRWGEAAKAKAERTLNAALSASKTAMAQAMHDNAKTTAAAVQKEVGETITHQLKPTIREARRVSIMNLIAAGMTVCAAGLALWASW